MAGTKIGGLRTAAKLKARDPLHYQKIGAMGGKTGGNGGFSGQKTRARLLGALGGLGKRKKRLQGEALQDYLRKKQSILTQIAELDRQEREA